MRRANPTPESQKGGSLSDPVTFEVFKNALTGIADEMAFVMLRTSHSPTLNEGLDFSTALCDAQGQVLAQANLLMVQLGTIPAAMAMVLGRYAGAIYAGDVLLFNDTDEATQHLNDLYTIQPCFMGDVLLGFSVCLAHHVDVGGSVPGSMDISASEIFQEGLQIPLVKLFERGRRNDAVMEIIRRNVRMPDLLEGDLNGQLAALRVGELGLVQLAERHSIAGLQQLSRELLDYTERLTRMAIRSIPDGVYEFEDWLDDDFVEHKPVRLRVSVRVSSDDVTVDWSGTGKQVRAALNCHLTTTRSLSYGAVHGAIQGAVRGDIPTNEGFYRAITVKAPLGSIVNPRRPAARGTRGITIYPMMDTLLGALSRAVPYRIPAASDGGPAQLTLSGFDSLGSTWVKIFSLVSGWGGRPGLDGIDGVSSFLANFANVPIEEIERDCVVRIDRLGYVPDTGGPGKWRGCLSVAMDLRFLTDGVAVQLRTQRRTIRPYGLAGGRSGTPSANILDPGPHQQDLPIYANFLPVPGSVLRHIHAGGGGFGNPLERDPHAVLDDVLDEKITVDYARQEYGVVIDLAQQAVDLKETHQVRAAHRSEVHVGRE